MAQLPWYTLFGFCNELDWRTLHFVEPIPPHSVCDVCGLLSRRTFFLSCGHMLCKTCYEQCMVFEVYECPLDGDQFREEDAQMMELPVENLLRRKVKCWNKDNGCEAIVNVSDIVKHFNEDCVHHSARCPSCTRFVLCRNLCAHRKSTCSPQVPASEVQNQEPSQDSLPEAMIADLKTSVERVKEMTSGLHQVVQDHKTICDRLHDESHVVNALIESSEKQVREANEARIASAREVKEGLTAQGGRLDRVAERISEHVKIIVTDATRPCLEKLEECIDEFRRRFARDDIRLETVSQTVSSLETTLGQVAELQTEIVAQKYKTSSHSSAASSANETESGHEASDEREDQLLALKTLNIKQHVFYVTGVKALKEEAVATGWAVYYSEPIYLRGYRISPGLYLKKNESTVSVDARILLHKGAIDEYLPWPFCYDVKLSFMRSSSDEHSPFLTVASFDVIKCGRRNESTDSGPNCSKVSLLLEELEREEYVESDNLYVKYELLPPTVL